MRKQYQAAYQAELRDAIRSTGRSRRGRRLDVNAKQLGRLIVLTENVPLNRNLIGTARRRTARYAKRKATVAFL